MTMRAVLRAVLAFSILAPAAAERREVFFGAFQNKLAKEWKFVGGQWLVREGCLEQTDPGPADPKKAILIIGRQDDYASDVVITAKLRLHGQFRDGQSRAGISVCC